MALPLSFDHVAADKDAVSRHASCPRKGNFASPLPFDLVGSDHFSVSRHVSCPQKDNFASPLPFDRVGATKAPFHDMLPVRDKTFLLRHFLSTVLAQPERHLPTCFLSAKRLFCFAFSLRPCWIRPFFRLTTKTCPLFPIHKKPARIFRPGRLLFAVFFTPRTSACTRRTAPCIRRCPHGFRAAFRACSCCGASRQ